MPIRNTGQENRASAVQYAVWMMGQSPRIRDDRIPGLVGRRYPELDLGEIDRLVDIARDSVGFGVVLMGLPQDQTPSREDHPVDDTIGPVYRYNVTVQIPDGEGGLIYRHIIHESDHSLSAGELVNEIIRRHIEEYEFPTLMGGAGIDKLNISQVSVRILSASRGAGT